MHCSGGLWSCEKIGIGQFPSLHHRKEGWPSDQKIIAKPPLTARPGWFSDENKWRLRAFPYHSVCADKERDHSLGGAATPPTEENALTVGAVYDRPFFLDSTKYGRS